MNNSRRAPEATPLLTIEDVAALLNCSRRSIYDLMDRGELPYVRFLRCRRVEEKVLADFVARHRMGTRSTRS